MSGIKTATVEALTAEVRVLMVGSRQITLSVVRQLDEVDPGDLEPFGRVRAARHPGAHDIEVVGSATGVLAYSRARIQDWVCDTENGGNRCDLHIGWLADQEMPPWAVRYSGLPTGQPPSWSWHPQRNARDLGAEWERKESDLVWKRHYWHTYIPDDATYRKWEALPLIVLAGLR